MLKSLRQADAPIPPSRRSGTVVDVDDSLDAFFSSYPPHFQYEETWPLATPLPLRARLGFCDILPPPAFRSSVLAIVFRDDGRVLFFHPPTPMGDIAHLIPGGRSEEGEPATEGCWKQPRGHSGVSNPQRTTLGAHPLYGLGAS